MVCAEHKQAPKKIWVCAGNTNSEQSLVCAGHKDLLSQEAYKVQRMVNYSKCTVIARQSDCQYDMCTQQNRSNHVVLFDVCSSSI